MVPTALSIIAVETLLLDCDTRTDARTPSICSQGSILSFLNQSNVNVEALILCIKLPVIHCQTICPLYWPFKTVGGLRCVLTAAVTVHLSGDGYATGSFSLSKPDILSESPTTRPVRELAQAALTALRGYCTRSWTQSPGPHENLLAGRSVLQPCTIRVKLRYRFVAVVYVESFSAPDEVTNFIFGDNDSCYTSSKVSARIRRVENFGR